MTSYYCVAGDFTQTPTLQCVVHLTRNVTMLTTAIIDFGIHILVS